MTKLTFVSPDLTARNITRIEELFPNCVTEALDEERSTPERKVYKKAVNFELLKQMLSPEVIDGEEAYEFTWVGKKAAIVEANKPIRKTLRPCPEESKNWDSTENLYIEGDNLEVLKLLQESYLGKVKMIYIDPPYNTGSDFIYRDDFAMDTEEYAEESGQLDEEGNRLFRNTDSNGRFHSDWCSMIYSRLMLARNLLTDDGVIFISIDDNEQENLKKICDEVFGEENFVATILREAIRGGSLSNNIRNVHDFVLCYAKNLKNIHLGGVEREGIELNYTDENGDYAKGRELNKWGAGSRREDSPSMFYPIPGPNGEDVYPIRNDGSEGRWRLGKEKMFALLNAGNAIFEPRGDGTYIVYEKIRDNSPKQKQFTTWFSNDYINAKGTQEIKELFNLERTIFDYSKPTKLIHDLLILNNSQDCIILDFFSGSATTAHAVMQLNAEDSGKRKFIMVQLPEPCAEDSEAFKAGYKNICEIGKERIRRAGEKIKEETGADIDTGFRVLKLDDTNMKDVYYSPAEYDQQMLDGLESNIKDDRSDLDLLFGCLLDWGLPLSLPYTSEKIDGFTVHTYNGGDLIACFDENISDAAIKEIAKRQPLRAVFRDSSFYSSPEKINVGEIFKMLAPDTRVKVI